MTMNELVEYIAESLAIPSPEAKTRIGRELNVRYKQVSTAIGMIPTRREEFATVATIGSRLITFTGAEKLDTVFLKVGTQNTILDEVTNDEMLKLPVRSGDEPRNYSVFTVAPASVIIKLDCIPLTGFAIYAHGLGDATTLSSNDQPNFPESFHDVLVHGVRADEWRRKDKDDKAKDAEQMFEKRLSDLKMFIAKSAYLNIYRGKHTGSEGWWDDK